MVNVIVAFSLSQQVHANLSLIGWHFESTIYGVRDLRGLVRVDGQGF